MEERRMKPSATEYKNHEMTVEDKEEVESEKEVKEETEEETEVEEEDNREHFDNFPTMKELRYHEWLLKNPRLPWVKAKIRISRLQYNWIMIGQFNKEQAYIDLESPVNIMSRLQYNWIMSNRLEPRRKPSKRKKNCHFVGRVRRLKVFVGNFTYECNFMVLEDTTSVIDHYLGSVVFEKPFVEATRLVYIKGEGTGLLIEDPSPPHPIIPNQTKSPMEEPKHSFRMWYKHFSTNLVTNDVAEPSTKNLVPIPRESKVTSDLSFLFILPRNKESGGNMHSTSTNSDSQQEEIDVVTKMNDVLPPGVENDNSVGEVDVVDDLRVDDSISNSKHESSESEDFDFDNLSIPLPPPKPPDKELDFEIDFGNEISVVRNTIVEFEFDTRVKLDVFNDKNDDLSYFMFVKVFSLLSAESEDMIFDPDFIESPIEIVISKRSLRTIKFKDRVELITRKIYPRD
nr:protein kinase-like domain, concanavalin A-like lectin/glucanase domain protein [Tanacetum cinerariifolium]